MFDQNQSAILQQSFIENITIGVVYILTLFWSGLLYPLFWSGGGQICPPSGNEPKNKIWEKSWAEVIIRLDLPRKSP